MKKAVLIFTFLLLSVGINNIFAENKLAIGFGWPYLSLKYSLSTKIASEIKYATGEGIDVLAVREYWNFYNIKKVTLFTGAEVGYITFNSLGIKGRGYLGSLFLGGESFIREKLSIALDFSPTFISLRSNSMGVNGIEFVANLVVYYYLSLGKK